MIEQRTRVPIRLFIIRKFTCFMVATRSSLRRTVTCARQTPIDQWTILSTWMNASNSGQSQRVGVVMHVDLALFDWQSHAHDWFFKKFHCTTMHSPNVSLILFYFALATTTRQRRRIDCSFSFFSIYYYFLPPTISLSKFITQKFIFPYSKMQQQFIFFSSFFLHKEKSTKVYIIFFQTTTKVSSL